MENLIKAEIKLICCYLSEEDEVDGFDRLVTLDDYRKFDLDINVKLTEDNYNKLVFLVKDLGAAYECLKVGPVRPFVITAYNYEEAERINDAIQEFLEKVPSYTDMDTYKLYVNIFYADSPADESRILNYSNDSLAENTYHELLSFLENCPNILNIINPIEDGKTKYICFVCSNREKAIDILLQIEDLCEKPDEEIDSIESDIYYITHNLDIDDLFLQMAEEAAELSQACLKYVRAHKGNNPTKDSEDIYLKGIIEEFTDVQVCAEAIDITADSDIHDSKIHRWADRIRKKNGGSSK